ncbi:hypothetical protein CR513_14115, partial [Mucuna pruriens]
MEMKKVACVVLIAAASMSAAVAAAEVPAPAPGPSSGASATLPLVGSLFQSRRHAGKPAQQFPVTCINHHEIKISSP